MTATLQETFFWYDYETSGADPSRDRPLQFAGIRTDLELNIVDEPVMFYARPSDDFLPHPQALLITGLTMQICAEQGLCEAEFMTRVHEQLARPGTCSVGYNTLRFDDEVTRYGLYRNFFDPYAREWQNGCSRWDIIDMVRLTRALRPQGIVWPSYEDGTPSLRLEDLARANQLEQARAHDALSDVHATIGLARLIRERQPKLFDYVYQNRSKKAALAMLDLATHKPVLHVSSRYGAERSNLALVSPLAMHPHNRNAVIVWDLSVDPEMLQAYSAEQLSAWLYTSNETLLAQGGVRPGLKLVHLNRAPVLCPAGMINADEAQRLQIDGALCRSHLAQLRQMADLAPRVQQIYALERFPSVQDPDRMLYSGGFFSDTDRQLMEQVRTATEDELAHLQLPFQDPRLEEMLLRYKARNYPHLLNEDEALQWEEYRSRRLLGPDNDGALTIAQLFDEMNRLAADGLTERDMHLLEELNLYVQSIYPMEI